MTEPAQDRLFSLLPAAHRLRDLDQGHVLRALLGVLERELGIVERDIDQLYDDWFIETCEEWVVPYIGDLLGVRRPLPTGEVGVSQRAAVANALSYRRRKGTAAVLEQLSLDVSGWPAAVVEFFGRLATTQYLTHLRPDNVATASLRRASQLELIGTPFDTTSRTVDVRHIDSGRGRHNIGNVGVFVCRLRSYQVTGADAGPGPGEAGRYTFNPLGLDAPLFNLPRDETEITELATEATLPLPLRRRALHEELGARRRAELAGVGERYFGDPPVFRIRLDGNDVALADLTICHLADWRRPPGTAQVAVDPSLGRLTLPAGAPRTTRVSVDYSYGFSGDLGGGPYDRTESLAAELDGRAPDRQLIVTAAPPAGEPDVVATLAAAIRAWNNRPAGLGVIALADSRSYADPLPEIVIPAGNTVVIVAARRADGTRVSASGVRPHVRANLTVRGAAAADAPDAGALVLNGLLVEGTVTVAPGNLGRLTVAHSTLVPQPDAASLTVGAPGNSSLRVLVERSVSGSLNLPSAAQVVLGDSIVDGGAGRAIVAAALDVQASTVVGLGQPQTRDVLVRARSLEASNSIFTGVVLVERRQIGCLRFSYCAPGSLVPRRFRCHPAGISGEEPVRPSFSSTRYGDPSYGQLAPWCPVEISTGAEDEGEMGAFGFLHQPQRLDNLRASLHEHLRFGLEAGIVFVT